MKSLKITILTALALVLWACGGGTGTSQTSTADTTAGSTPQEITQALEGDHADTSFTYQATGDGFTLTKEIEIPAGQNEEDFAVTLVENEVPKFIEQFKGSTAAGDVAIKEKGVAISVSFINKATGEEITQFDITPEDLK